MTGKNGMKQCAKSNSWQVDTPRKSSNVYCRRGHESGGFRVLSENLNYSAQALNTIFPKYFRRAGRDYANEYLRQPEKIANVIYANRMDNGDAPIAATAGVLEAAEYYSPLVDTTIHSLEKQWKCSRRSS